jgi:hypothetical protein
MELSHTLLIHLFDLVESSHTLIWLEEEWYHSFDGFSCGVSICPDSTDHDVLPCILPVAMLGCTHLCQAIYQNNDLSGAAGSIGSPRT